MTAAVGYADPGHFYSKLSAPARRGDRLTATVSDHVSVTLQTPGPLLFKPDVGPDGVAVLFASDVSAATVFAVALPSEGSTAAGHSQRSPGVELEFTVAAGGPWLPVHTRVRRWPLRESKPPHPMNPGSGRTPT